jgi:uncharacterized repeat protein (TIGR03803 family)
LVSFNLSNGASPDAELIADSNGDLFGTTGSGGGANGNGTVFEIRNTGTVAAPVYASAPTTLVSFNGSNGSQPRAGLIVDAKGDLLGTTFWRRVRLRYGVRDHGGRLRGASRADNFGNDRWSDDDHGSTA